MWPQPLSATRQRRQWKRHFKSEFTFLQTSSPLFQLFYFVDCKRIVLKMNFCWLHPTIERGRKPFRARFCPLQAAASEGFIWQLCSYGIKIFQKAWSTCRIVVFLIKPFAFCRSVTSCLLTFPDNKMISLSLVRSVIVTRVKSTTVV